MYFAAQMDEFGKPAWIALTVLGFCLYWPVGLAILAYLFWSGRMACWKHDRWARRQEQWARAAGRGGWGGMHEAADRWFSGMRQPRSSGNWAFDEYRADTLRRLEEEERGFRDFLERLRRAKDKEEFDQFLAERRGQASHPPEGQAPHGQV
jgi:hypothetical protein